MAARASRALCFCCAIRVLKPAISISRPDSAAISFVRSTGNPKVSLSLKTSSPGRKLFLSVFTFLIIDSRIDKPLSIVAAKRSSSIETTFLIYSSFSVSSGYSLIFSFATTGTISARKVPLIPRRRPCRAARLRRRRST